MTRWFTGLVLLVALPVRGAGPPPILMERFAGVVFGMTVAEAKAAEELREIDPNDDCYHAFWEPDHRVSFMVAEGRVVRIDVFEPGVQTEEGVQVGSAETAVRTIYGKRVRTEQHHYDPSGHYMIVNSGNGRHAIIFETDGETVTSIRAGEYPAVEWVEGCL